MQQPTTFKKFFYKNAYLLVLAAWLVTISFVVENYWSVNASIGTVQKELTNYIHKNEKDVAQLVEDTALLNRVATNNISEAELKSLIAKKYFLFFYTTDATSHETLSCWNTQQVLPYPSLLYEKRDKGFVKLQNGFYVWNRYVVNAVKVIALIPVKWDYIIENENLGNTFVIDKSITPIYQIVPKSDHAVAVTSINGRELFYITEKQTVAIYKNNPLAIVLEMAAVLLVLLFVQLCASFFAIRGKLGKALAILLLSITGVRLIGFFLKLPVNFRQFELFDPAIYSSSSFLPSLGDIFINAIFFVWIILFVRNHINESRIKVTTNNPYVKWWWLAICSVAIIFVTYAGSYLVRSLVADSKISFNVTNFFELSAYSAIGFIVLGCLAIGYFFLCQMLLAFVRQFFTTSLIPLYLVVAIGGLMVMSFRIGEMNGGFDIYVLLWLLAFLFLLSNNNLNLIASKLVSSKLVFWLFFFSVSITAIIVMENRKKELRNRLHYAEILATKTDPATEALVNTMVIVREEFLADNFYRLQDAALNWELKDSLKTDNIIAAYSNKYQTRIYSYTADEKPLFNEDSTRYNDINTILNTQAKPTGTAGLYYYDEAYDLINYISKKTLYAPDGKLLGYVFILVSPKKQKEDAISPTLFSNSNNNSIETSSLYAYAIYKNRKLVTSHNDYPFPSVIAKTKRPQQVEFKQKNNYSELWYYAGADKMIVIARENSLSVESITLFSYFFCSFLIMTTVFWFINVVVRSRFNWRRFKSNWQFTIRNQIHGTIIFVSVVSFFVIGFATIMFFISRYDHGNREKLSRTIRIMENEVKNSLSKGWIMQDSLDADNDQRFEQLISKVSEIHGIDVNLYDLQGNLRVSSLPLPYVKGIVSTKMHPMAFYHLDKLKEVLYFQKENIGKLSFISNYVPVIDASGNGYAYLNIPYFSSQANLKEEISNFLVTIINLNAFIFLLAGIVALFITNRITNSFSVIGDKMKRINLGGINEAIEWKRDDELGELVNEYNKMVRKLDDSVKLIARNEREGAWKEMARQVAHEIKNPLTPMKLSMQFLQKSIESNAPNVKELTANVAHTLVEQIDHLSKIAGEFSQFANIENAKKEWIDVNELLRNVLHLYLANDRVRISSSLLSDKTMLFADRSHINRLFTNLILNAIQAVPENEMAIIVITEYKKDGKLLIKIEDNGPGIPEEIRSKIFTPNFTTKTSGTGLGLAMCKRMVEQADGRIWFETKEGGGTSFFIEFPLDGNR
ncbi:MAG: GHKL domain-containing protein [Bacteroidetes bacterium]|nr:GHKL domain-containing protein [Bacteroidota bacterium]